MKYIDIIWWLPADEQVTDLHRENVDHITIPSKKGKGDLKRVEEVREGQDINTVAGVCLCCWREPTGIRTELVYLRDTEKARAVVENHWEGVGFGNCQDSFFVPAFFRLLIWFGSNSSPWPFYLKAQNHSRYLFQVICKINGFPAEQALNWNWNDLDTVWW